MSEILVTAMIVVRNEEKYINISLPSLLKQDFPKDKYEILVVDGMSDDNTMENIHKILKKYEESVKVTIFKNEKKLLAPRLEHRNSKCQRKICDKNRCTCKSK